MLWAFGLVLALVAGPKQELPSGTVVLYPPTASTLVRTAEAIAELDRSAVLLPVGEPWDRKAPPRQVVALGQRAASRARSEWPTTIRAEAFTWNGDRPDVALTLLGRPAQACVVAGLKARDPEQWLILSTEDDEGAGALAEALGAQLAVGSPRELQDRVRSLDPGVSIWLRGHPDLSSVTWLQNIPHLAGSGRFVGTDLPGLARFGFATPVVAAPDDIATRLVDWMHSPSRRKRRRRVEELPCPSE